METRTSAIVLAGGYSLRMGRNKAELDFHGKSFVQHQVDKIRRLGIEDIVLAGYSAPLEGARFAPDLYPHRGPLSGIHAGLLAIREPCALVLAVDTPLVPEALLLELLAAHQGGVTVAEAHRSGVTLTAFRGDVEPLIGVYDRALAQRCEDILQGSATSIRQLLHRVPLTALPYTGDPRLLANCNTPEEYERICAWKDDETPPGP